MRGILTKPFKILSEYVIMQMEGVIYIMEGIIKDYATEDIEKRKLQIEIRLQRQKVIQETLEKYFGFKIPNYIIDDIVVNETYHHICLMINLATVNERLSTENADRLKEGIKEIFSIENSFDILKSEQILNEFTSKYFK